jgi:OOP family OmpA-OmpF porin
MNPTQRWTIVGVIVLVIALLWLFWPKSEQKPAPVKGPVTAVPAEPKPAPAPPAPKTEALPTTVVLFAYNQSAVRPAEAPKLDELAAKLKGGSSDAVNAVGHADRIGGEAYNLALSEKRAAAVRAYLAGKGVDAKRIRAEARGEEQPVTGDACKNMGSENRRNRKLIECLQRDRRVEVGLAAGR